MVEFIVRYKDGSTMKIQGDDIMLQQGIIHIRRKDSRKHWLIPQWSIDIVYWEGDIP